MNTVSMKSVQLTHQLLGGGPGFSTIQQHSQHYRSIHHPLGLHCQVRCIEHRITETAKSPRCLSNPAADLTNHSTTCLNQRSQILKLFNHFHHTSIQFQWSQIINSESKFSNQQLCLRDIQGKTILSSNLIKFSGSQHHILSTGAHQSSIICKQTL